MTELEQIVVGRSSIPALTLTVLLMIAIPVAFFLYWRRKHRERIKRSYLIAGAVGFLVSARVLELGVHYVCIVLDNPVSRFLNGSTAAYVLYGVLMAGVFEECGRHLILNDLWKRGGSADKTNPALENAVLYGIGHGGIEILAVVLPGIVTYLVIAVLFSRGPAKEAMAALKITEDTAAAGFDFAAMALNVLERVFAMLLHIGLTVIVYDGVVTGRRLCLPLAIGLHMLTDVFPALYQKGAAPLWSVELWAAFWTAAVCLLAHRAARKLRTSDHSELSGS